MKNNDIIIDNWADGIAPSLYAGRGMGDIQCCDIRSMPGLVRTNYALKKDNEAMFKTPVYQILKNDDDYYFLVDPTEDNNVGLVIKRTPAGGGTYSVAVDTSLPVTYTAGAIYKGYIILRRATINDAMLLSDNSLISGAFNSAAFSVDGTYSSIISDGTVLFMATGYQVKTVFEKDGQTFNPSNSATYTWNQYSLTLTSNYDIFDLQLVNNYLAVIAFDKSTSKATVFYWDKTSASWTAKCDLPVRPKACIVDGEWLYYIGGKRGEIYRTTGATNQYIKTLPENIVNIAYASTGVVIYKEAIAKENGKIYFATSGGLTSPLAAIWTLDLNTMALNRPHILSTGNTSGVAETIDITALYAGGDLVVAYEDNNKTTTSIHAVDIKDTANFQSNYGSYIDTQMYYATTDALNNSAFQGISVFLAKPLVSGDKIKFGFRTADNHKASSSSTTVTAFTDMPNSEITAAGQQYFKIPFARNLKSVQLRIYLQGQTYLKSVILHR